MSDIRTFEIERDWNGIGCNIFAKRKISLTSGVTILVGCNGAGKTTLLHQLETILQKKKLPVIRFDNLRDGGHNARSELAFFQDFAGLANSLCGSEGENINMNLGRFASRLGDFVRKQPPGSDVFILLDAVDSGYSVDNIVDLKGLFDLILQTADGRFIYIIASANEYELARGESCYDVNKCKYVTFKDYEEYRKFILDSRELKNARVYKKEDAE